MNVRHMNDLDLRIIAEGETHLLTKPEIQQMARDMLAMRGALRWIADPANLGSAFREVVAGVAYYRNHRDLASATLAALSDEAGGTGCEP